LVGSLFSSIIGTILPGEGSIYLSQTYSFKKPIFINEKVKAEVEVTNIREDKPIITLKTICYNSKDEIAIEGEAIVKIYYKSEISNI
jgi:acyl dehydratase